MEFGQTRRVVLENNRNHLSDQLVIVVKAALVCRQAIVARADDESARGAGMECWLVTVEFAGVEPEVVSKALRGVRPRVDTTH